MVQYVDNWMDEALTEWFWGHFLYETPHFWGHRSGVNSSNYFYATHLEPDSHISNMIKYKLRHTINDFSFGIEQVYINIQHANMHSDMHYDTDSDITALWMVSPNPENGGGQFEYEDGIIEYEQNRLIMFEGKSISHKGVPFNNEVYPRITLAAKMFRG
jgi:hypothetical protein